MMHIKSDVKNGKKILIIKDSYGNAFSPFLCAHYEDVYIVDYRYLKSNIKNIMKKYSIDNIIFAHNVFVINSSYTTYQENKFLNSNFNIINTEFLSIYLQHKSVREASALELAKHYGIK